MRIIDSRTGQVVLLRKRFERDAADAFTVLSVTIISRTRARVSLIAGSPERLRSVVAEVTGWWFWRRVYLP